jgi:hypothetical protein
VVVEERAGRVLALRRHDVREGRVDLVDELAIQLPFVT